MDEIFENPDRGKSTGREAVKWLLVRLLPRSAYQRVLARSKASDFEERVRHAKVVFIPPERLSAFSGRLA